MSYSKKGVKTLFLTPFIFYIKPLKYILKKYLPPQLKRLK
jgi:hypothetical protein